MDDDPTNTGGRFLRALPRKKAKAPAPPCAATNRKTGEPCKRRAALGTRVCVAHGAGRGITDVTGPDHPNWTNGHKSQIFRKRNLILTRINEILDDPEWRTVARELAHLRLQLHLLIASQPSDPPYPLDIERRIFSMSRDIGNLVKIQHAIEFDQDHLYNAVMLAGIAARIYDEVAQIRDEDDRARVLRGVGNVFATPRQQYAPPLIDGER